MTSLSESFNHRLLFGSWLRKDGSEVGLAHVDFRLTSTEVGVHTVVGGLAIRGGVENIADDNSVGEGAVRDLSALGATAVS